MIDEWSLEKFAEWCDRYSIIAKQKYDKDDLNESEGSSIRWFMKQFIEEFEADQT